MRSNQIVSFVCLLRTSKQKIYSHIKGFHHVMAIRQFCSNVLMECVPVKTTQNEMRWLAYIVKQVTE